MSDCIKKTVCKYVNIYEAINKQWKKNTKQGILIHIFFNLKNGRPNPSLACFLTVLLTVDTSCSVHFRQMIINVSKVGFGTKRVNFRETF